MLQKAIPTFRSKFEMVSSIELPSKPLTIVATSNDPWGPTGTDMAEIAALTFNK